MHYQPHVDFAFNSVEHIMRDVNNGWLIRYTLGLLGKHKHLAR